MSSSNLQYLLTVHCPVAFVLTDTANFKPMLTIFLPTDIDECNGTNPCAPYGNCVNTNGSFTCNCSSGYELDIDGQTCSGKCIPGTLVATHFMLGVNRVSLFSALCCQTTHTPHHLAFTLHSIHHHLIVTTCSKKKTLNMLNLLHLSCM